MHVAGLLAGGRDDPRRVVTLVERVRGAVEEADPVAVQAADHVDRLEPVLDEVVGVRATRALLLAEPASVDGGEITDKGYINQRAVLDAACRRGDGAGR